jgi:hypothetical protein
MQTQENISFEEVWADIRRRLRVGDRIKNWSVHGYTGTTFRIVGVDNTAVRVSSGRMQDKGKGRLVSRGEFERFFPLWPAYKAGTVQRTALTAASQNTTYVISILHWQDPGRLIGRREPASTDRAGADMIC